MSKMEMKKLQEDMQAAYNKWRTGVDEHLSDGAERRIKSEETSGFSTMLDDGYGFHISCFIDEVKMDTSRNVIKCHLAERDYDACDEWVDIYDVAVQDQDAILMNIEWKE